MQAMPGNDNCSFVSCYGAAVAHGQRYQIRQPVRFICSPDSGTSILAAYTAVLAIPCMEATMFRLRAPVHRAELETL